MEQWTIRRTRKKINTGLKQTVMLFVGDRGQGQHWGSESKSSLNRKEAIVCERDGLSCDRLLKSERIREADEANDLPREAIEEDNGLKGAVGWAADKDWRMERGRAEGNDFRRRERGGEAEAIAARATSGCAKQENNAKERVSRSTNCLGVLSRTFPQFCLTYIGAWTTHWSQSSITDGLLANKFAAWNWAKSRTFAFPVALDWLAGKKTKTREETNQQTNNKKKENEDEKENRTNNRNWRKTKHEWTKKCVTLGASFSQAFPWVCVLFSLLPFEKSSSCQGKARTMRETTTSGCKQEAEGCKLSCTSLDNTLSHNVDKLHFRTFLWDNGSLRSQTKTETSSESEGEAK